MADVTIDSSIDGVGPFWRGLRAQVWTTDQIGYVFYLTDTSSFVYRKTSNGGTTWAAEVTISTHGGASYKFDIWFDRWTPGDSGTKIHIVYIRADSVDDFHYRNLDTASDTFSSDIPVVSNFDSEAQSSWLNGICSITKAVNGNLYTQWWNQATAGTSERGFFRSTDGGANWTERTDGADGDAIDYPLLFPANLADPADIWMIYWDLSANEIFLKTYDDSANTWASASIATGMADSTTAIQMSGAVRHSDGHLIFAAWTALDAATADLRCWDITDGSTITAKTDVLTNNNNAGQCAVFINQNNNDIYVAFLDGTSWGADVHAKYKKSTDGGTAWGAETTLSVTNDNHLAIWAALSVKSGDTGRFEPWWCNWDLDDAVTNVDNSIVITAGSTPKTVSDSGAVSETIIITAVLSPTDSGVVAEVLAILAQVPLEDSGLVTDDILREIFITPTDTGTGAEDVGIIAQVPVTDQPTAADTPDITAQVGTSDSGASSEDVGASVAIPITDDGISVQSPFINGTVPVPDAGSPGESVGIAVAVPVDDSGSVVEGQDILALVTLGETGDVSEGITVDQGLGVVTIQTTGTASEDVTLTAQVIPGEAGAGTEGFGITAVLTVGDTGTGGEEVPVSVPITVADGGSEAALAVILTQFTVTDEGLASEAITAQMVAQILFIPEGGNVTELMAILAQVPLPAPHTGSFVVFKTSGTAVLPFSGTAARVGYYQATIVRLTYAGTVVRAGI